MFDYDLSAHKLRRDIYNPYTSLRGDNEFELDERISGINCSISGFKHAIYTISIWSQRIAPGVDEITLCIIEQPNSTLTVRYASVEGLSNGNGVNVQTYIWESGVSHRLGKDRLWPGERPFR